MAATSAIRHIWTLVLAASLTVAAIAAPADATEEEATKAMKLLAEDRARKADAEARARALAEARAKELEARGRLAEAAREGPGIFVPEPKGADQTLDQPAAAGPQAQVVTTDRGDRITGEVLGIEPDGRLRLTAPGYEGELLVLVSALDQVTLAPKVTASGQDQVLVANGDRILGELTAIDEETVQIKSDAAGMLEIPRPMVEVAAFARGQLGLVSSDFARGQMDPWQIVRGGWTVSDGALVCAGTNSQSAVYAKLDQDEAITFEAKVEATGGQQPYFQLIVFADDSQHYYGRNSIFARFYGTRYYLRRASNGGTSSVHSGECGRDIRSGTLRLSYDPATKKAAAWLDSRKLGECVIPNGVTKGQYVMFSSRYPCKVHHLRVVRGVSASDSPGGTAEGDVHLVGFANKDHVKAVSVSLADGEFVVRTPYAEAPLSGPVRNLRTIVFKTAGQQRPRRQKGDVLVRTVGGQLTLRLEKLTDQHLIGHCEYLGKVAVLRAAIRQIRFNIYK